MMHLAITERIWGSLDLSTSMQAYASRGPFSHWWRQTISFCRRPSLSRRVWSSANFACIEPNSASSWTASASLSAFLLQRGWGTDFSYADGFETVRYVHRSGNFYFYIFFHSPARYSLARMRDANIEILIAFIQRPGRHLHSSKRTLWL